MKKIDSTLYEIPTLTNNEIIYFDYSATTFMPNIVLNKWRESNIYSGVSIGRGSSILSKRAKKQLEESEKIFRDFFGFSDEYDFIYTKNVTESINLLAISLENSLSALDIILIGPYEHHSNYLPWQRLAKKSGALFYEIPLLENGDLDYEYIRKYKNRIKIISVSSVSNTNGYYIDVDKILNVINEDTLLFVDESQLTAHRKIKCNSKISAHFISSHKMYGPKNISLIAMKKELINKIDPVILGGGMVETVGYDTKWNSGRNKFLSGTMDIPLISAFAEACKFVESISYEKIKSEDDKYFEVLKECLIKNGYEIINTNNSVNYIVSFYHKNIHSHDINEYLSQKNIIIRSGNVCSQNSLRKMNINSINRISFGVGTTEEKLNKLCDELKTLINTNNIYSKKIDDLILNKNNVLIIPDLIMIKEGIACGDKLVISGQIDNNILRFSFFADDACSLSKAICSYIEKEFNLRDIDTIINEIKSFYKKAKSNSEYLFEKFDLDYNKYSERTECMISPIELFIDFLENIQNNKENFSEKPNTLKRMECDACTGSCRINWKNEEIKKSDHHEGKVYTTEYLKKWLPYGKITLSEKEIEKLPDTLKDMTDEDYQFLSDHTINSFVLNNIMKYCPEELNSKWKATSYLTQKTEITTRYFNEIKNYIREKNLNIYSVKGYVSQKYYEDPALRIHSDFDLIAEKVEDSFELMYYLLNKGFTIRPNLFSLKDMYDNNLNQNCVSGHFHLQKIIDDMYNFEIDLIFPGFPINRVELFFPKVIDNSISIESQIIITLLHLFKHSNIYMKDINDLYYMLHQDLDLKYLSELIKKYNLFSFFELAVSYIKYNYKIDNEKMNNIINYFNINLDSLNNYIDWPYNLDAHLKIKQSDFNDRTKITKEFERIYLFPIMIFKKIFDVTNIKEIIEKNYKITKISNCIYKIEKNNYVFYLTNIGIFIENYIDTTKLHRTEYISILETFLIEIGKPELFDIPYATEHFYVRVI